MNYLKIYNKTIQKYLDNLVDKDKEYCENHHILPRSFGGTDDPDNMVLLPIRVHIFCHELLFMHWKNMHDTAKTAKAAWALKRFMFGKKQQKISVKHCFKSKMFANAVEFGKKMQRQLKWITNDIENDQIFSWEPLPEGWRWGMRKNKKRRNRWITDGIKNTRIYPDDPLPQGWRDGFVHNENYQSMWITNGVLDRKINVNEPIPPGWRRGIHKSRTTDKTYIHKIEGSEIKRKMICKGDVIPEGWKPGCGESSQKGKIRINNGVISKVISPNDEIPNGWRIGDLPRKRRGITITDGHRNMIIKETDEIPAGWYRGTARAVLYNYKGQLITLTALLAKLKISRLVYRYHKKKGLSLDQIIARAEGKMSSK